MVVEQANSKVQFAAMSNVPNVIKANECNHVTVGMPCHNQSIAI